MQVCAKEIRQDIWMAWPLVDQKAKRMAIKRATIEVTKLATLKEILKAMKLDLS